MAPYGSFPSAPHPLGKQIHEEIAPYGISTKMAWLHHRPSELRSNRRRLNGGALLVVVLVPWAVFCLAFWLMSFHFHYNFPGVCFLALALILVLSSGVFALLAYVMQMKTAAEPDEEREPMWYWFLCGTCFLAIVAGGILGSMNFGTRMHMVYDLQNLGTYYDVNPAMYVGQQLVDAGRVQFQRSTYLDVGKSMGFKDTNVYCVAPIVSPNTTNKTYLDFWAVGVNCCSGTQADFHCEGYKDSRYKGGLRLMNDGERPFYRLAVQQAEATYNISTRKPLFFVWSKDTIEYAAKLQYSGFRMYTFGIFAALVVQCALVVTAALVFAKQMPTREA